MDPGSKQKLKDITEIPNGTVAAAVEDAGESVVVTFAPDRHRSTFEVAASFGFVRETNYGRLFDVRVEPRPGNLAYTSRRILPHTDTCRAATRTWTAWPAPWPCWPGGTNPPEPPREGMAREERP